MGHVFSSGQSDSRSDWRSIQVGALAGTRPCHHDRGRSTMHSSTRQIGVVWLSHGNKLISCHPTQLRRCSEREISIASLKGLVPISVPTSVTELTNALSLGQYEDLPTDKPAGDDLRFGEEDLEVPLIRKPWHLLLCRCFLLAPLSSVAKVIHPESCFCICWS